MKRILFVLFLTLAACDRNQFYPQVSVQPATEKRLVLENKQVVSLRADNPDGTYTTTTSNFINLARVKAPSATTSFGDVQATGVAIQGNFAYVSYNTAGEEVSGAIDVINIANPALPELLYTYTSNDYEFADVKTKGHYLILSGLQKNVGAVLMILNIADPANPTVDKIEQLTGIYATDIDLYGNTLVVSTGSTGGLTEYNVSDPANPQRISFKAYRNALSVATSEWFNFILFGDTQTKIEVDYRNGYHSAFTDSFNENVYSYVLANAPSEAPSRIQIKNALGYSLNTQAHAFRILDLSGVGKSPSVDSGFKNAGSLTVPGTANGFDLDNQKAYLALGEAGVKVLSLETNAPVSLGDMVFSGDNGSANNLWIDSTTSAQKYLFIAYGRQGLRILTEQTVAPTLSNKIKIYAKGMSSGGVNPHIQIKVNGQIFVADYEITSSTYDTYEWTYSRALNTSDVVQVIYINDNSATNPNSDINLYVGYLKVNDKYCYQEPLQIGNSYSDFGLYKTGQGIGYDQGACKTYNDQNIVSQCGVNEHIENNQCVNNTQACSITNGTGAQTWTGSGYGSCVVTSCNAGYTQQGNQCVMLVCSPNSTTSCSVGNGTGTKTCAADGMSYGACQINACNPGYTLQGQNCVPQVCSPNTTSACSANNGSGTQTCSSDGLSYGSCTLTSCNGGYTLQNGQCVAQLCTPNSTASCSSGNGSGIKTCAADGMSYGACQVNVCNSGYYLNGGTCVPQTCSPNSTQSCVQNHQNGTQTCNAQGSGYGTCVLGNTCQSGYYYSNGSCLPVVCSAGQTQNCTQNHQNGSQSCLPDGSGYGACQGNGTCESGYYYSNGQCVIQSCSPLSVTSCPVSNGTGTQVCNITGSGYGSCSIASCNSNYHLENNQCLSNTKACSDAQGTGTQTWNGSGYGACQYNSCQPGYYLNGTSCVAQVCSPNTASSCAVSNGTGTHTCNSVGSGYGSCTPVSCNSGYTLSGGSCVAQICSPNSSANCTSGNGSGTQTCSSDGLSYGSCTITSCQAGYTLQNGQCVAQLCSPNSSASCSVANGTGTKTCAADGMSYGSCSLVSCNSGYYNNNGTCTAQACTPNSTASCTVANGTGTKTCNAQGSAYGSCTATTCNSGYAVVNGQCQQNLCPVSSSLGINTYNNVSVNSNLVGADNDQVGTLSYILVTQPTKGTITNFNAATGSFTYVPNSNVQGSDSFTYKTNDTYCDSPISTVNVSIACSQGYVASGGQCLPQICNPNGTYSCSEGNGSGTKTCNSLGTAYGSCTLSSCNSGYYLNGGVCTAQACSPNSTTSCSVSNGSGTKTCNAQGSAYGSCTTTTCNSGYYLSGGSCIAQTCSPNTTASCSVSNGSGTKTCNSTGSDYGSCTATSCNSGYTLSGGVCVANQVCSPNSTTSCSIANGSGTKTCNSSGSGYGSCTASSCNYGYYPNGSVCSPFVCTPNSSQSCTIGAGYGNQYCNAQGSAYGSCQLHSCQSGYYLENNQCKAYVCTPNSSRSCGNGKGNQYCASDGLSWGSCQMFSCDQGQHVSNGQCVQDSACNGNFITVGIGSLLSICM